VRNEPATASPAGPRWGGRRRPQAPRPQAPRPRSPALSKQLHASPAQVELLFTSYLAVTGVAIAVLLGAFLGVNNTLVTTAVMEVSGGVARRAAGRVGGLQLRALHRRRDRAVARGEPGRGARAGRGASEPRGGRHRGFRGAVIGRGVTPVPRPTTPWRSRLIPSFLQVVSSWKLHTALTRA